MKLSAALLFSAVSAVLASPAADTSTRSSTGNRESNSEWESVTKGGDHSPEISHLNLRSQTVDPSSLGVDTVKQYSGYLDNDAGNKHFFFCESIFALRKVDNDL